MRREILASLLASKALKTQRQGRILKPEGRYQMFSAGFTFVSSPPAAGFLSSQKKNSDETQSSIRKQKFNGIKNKEILNKACPSSEETVAIT